MPVAPSRIFMRSSASMNCHTINADVLTCARMAAGMTSRARRPEDFISAG
jgi:hypothetical protein